MLRELLRRVEMKVIQENKLDVVVRLHTSLPPGKIGLAGWPGPPGDTRGDIRMGPYAGETEVLIPAGYVRTVYDATFVLSPDRQRYVAHQQRHADDAAGAGAAVLTGVPGRAGRGGSNSEGGVGVRGGVEATRAAAGVSRAARGVTGPQSRDLTGHRVTETQRISGSLSVLSVSCCT